jgi:hypothetical protein
VRHVSATSLDAIPTLDPQDAWFVDGDHNWYTVYHELAAIYEVHRAAGSPLLVFLHDAGWPWGRRDLYYAPERIPVEFRHPHSWELGVTLGSRSAVPGGFRGCGAFAVAQQEGGPRNGVLTAIEDFLAAHPDELYWVFVPGVFGLAVLFSRDHPAAQGLANLLAPLHEHALLKTLETNRLANYLKVIELQDATSGHSEALGPQDKSPHCGATQSDAAVATEGQAPSVENGMQAITDQILSALADGCDHPEVWRALGDSARTDGTTALLPLVQHLEALLDAQPPHPMARLLCVIRAVTVAELGQHDLGRDELNRLQLANSRSALVAGALFHVESLIHPEDQRDELQGTVRVTPVLHAASSPSVKRLEGKQS